MNAWDYLPNATHISLIINSHESDTVSWRHGFELAGDTKTGVHTSDAWTDAWRAAMDELDRLGRRDVWDLLKPKKSLESHGSLLALTVWDDCSYMLDSDIDELRILSRFGSHSATLMIPTVLTFKVIKEKEHVN